MENKKSSKRRATLDVSLRINHYHRQQHLLQVKHVFQPFHLHPTIVQLTCL